MYFAILLINFSATEVTLDLSCYLIAQVSRPCSKVGNVRVLYIFNTAKCWSFAIKNIYVDCCLICDVLSNFEIIWHEITMKLQSV
jgi:hypothetical protein